MRKITHHLTIAEAHADRVVLRGTFATADGKGTHSLLRPVLLHGEIERDPTVPLMVGDVVVRYDDGTHEHRPKSQ